MSDVTQIPIVIRFGDATLDFGVGTVPLVFLRFYRHIEGLNGERLRDAEAMLLVQVIALRADREFELRLANLPMAASLRTLEPYATKFRKMGIVFTSRVFFSHSEMINHFGPDDVPANPIMKAQRWDLSPLFHTVSLIRQDWLEQQQATVAAWKARGEQGSKPVYKFPDDYIRQVELPFDVAQRILNGEYFPIPPDYILGLAERVFSHGPTQITPVHAPTQIALVHGPTQIASVQEREPTQTAVVQATDLRRVRGLSITAAATAAGEEDEFCQLYLSLAGVDRDPTGEELAVIGRLLAGGILQETIQAGIEQVFRTRRQADGIPTLAQCVRVVRRLHHREHREHDAETTDRIPAADHTTGTVVASGLGAPAALRQAFGVSAQSNAQGAVQPAADQAADPLADVWAALREGSCPEHNYDTAANRLGLRHLDNTDGPEQLYRAVIEAIAYGVPPDRLVGYARSILERWAAEAQDEVAQVDTWQAAASPATPPQGSGAAEEQVWKTALAELRHQMTKATFDTWLCGTRLVQCTDSVATIAVRSEYARDWLENRLRPVVARTLNGILGHQVEVRFVVTGVGDNGGNNGVTAVS